MLQTPFILLLLTAAPEVSVRETVPIALFLNTPSAASSKLGLSQVIQSVTRRLDQHTDLAPVQIRREVFQRCVGALDCVFKRLGGSAQQARFLLILTLFPGRDAQKPDRLTVLLADRERLERCQRAQGEGCANEAISLRDGPRALPSVEALEGWLDRLFQSPLARIFEQAQRWEPYGTIELNTDLNGASILLDGRSVGVSKTGVQRLVQVRQGARTIGLSHPEHGERSAKLTLKAGEVQRLSFNLAPRKTWPKDSLQYGGIAIAALGAALSIWAIAYASQNQSIRAFCQDSCTGGRFWTLEQMVRGPAEASDRFPNRGSVKALPLGYSLVLGGGLISLITALWIEDDRDLWIPAVIGAASSALAYGVSAALD